MNIIYMSIKPIDTKLEVFLGKALMTGGKLKITDLKLNKYGNIISTKIKKSKKSNYYKRNNIKRINKKLKESITKLKEKENKLLNKILKLKNQKNNLQNKKNNLLNNNFHSFQKGGDNFLDLIDTFYRINNDILTRNNWVKIFFDTFFNQFNNSINNNITGYNLYNKIIYIIDILNKVELNKENLYKILLYIYNYYYEIDKYDVLIIYNINNLTDNQNMKIDINKIISDIENNIFINTNKYLNSIQIEPILFLLYKITK